MENSKIKITYDNTTFSNEYLLEICELSSGAKSLILSALSYYINYHKAIDTTTLRKISKLGKDTFRIYLSELISLGFIELYKKAREVGGYKNHIAFVLEDVEEDSPTRIGLLGKIGDGERLDRTEIGRKISETKRRTNRIIKEIIIEPYIAELYSRGLDSLVYKDYRRVLFAELNHAVAQYRDKLSPQDILNILIMALDNEYFINIGKLNSVDLIFFNRRTSIVGKYIIEKKKINSVIFDIVNVNKEKQSDEEFGHFVKKDTKFIHIPPTKKGAIYYIMGDEMERRLMGKSPNLKHDKYFNNKVLKPEYNYMIGSVGKNNRFVGV